jgi:putative oxidoreductase
MEIALFIVGKALYSLLFITSGISHIINRDAMAGYAQFKRWPAPMASVVVSGVLLIVAPVVFLVGFGWLSYVALAFIALFLLATAIGFHNFWTVEDPQARMNEQVSFYKNISLLGATIVIAALL